MMSARSDTTIERVLAGEEPYDGRWSVQAGANRSWEGSRNSTSRSVCTTPVCRGPRRMTTALPPSARRVALPGERTGTPGARGHQRLGKVHLRGGGAASVTHLPFINADEIAARSWPGEEAQRAYDASRAAATARAEGISGRRSFITETVFSHPSKLELIEHAVSAGYLVTLHSILVPEDVAVMRRVPGCAGRPHGSRGEDPRAVPAPVDARRAGAWCCRPRVLLRQQPRANAVLADRRLRTRAPYRACELAAVDAIRTPELDHGAHDAVE